MYSSERGMLKLDEEVLGIMFSYKAAKIFSVVVQNYAIFAINFTKDHRAEITEYCWPLLAVMSGAVLCQNIWGWPLLSPPFPLSLIHI